MPLSPIVLLKNALYRAFFVIFPYNLLLLYLVEVLLGLIRK